MICGIHMYVNKAGKKPHIHHLFVFGVGIVLYLFITLFYIFFCTIFAFLVMNLRLILNLFFFSWLRRPHVKLMENRLPRTMMTTKQVEVLRYIKEILFLFLVKILVFSSYNGPYTESGNDDAGLSSEYNMTPTFSRTNSLKKQHVHWPDVSKTAKNDNLHSILTESPSAHRRPTNSTLSHFIQTAIIPAGSTVSSTGTSQFLIPSKDFTSVSAGFNSLM